MSDDLQAMQPEELNKMEILQEKGKVKELEKLKVAKEVLIKREQKLKQELLGVDLHSINELSKVHKRLLHEVNETKDLGYYLMGVLAKVQQSSIKEVAAQYNVEE